MVQAFVEIRLVLGQIGDPGHVDGHHADGAGAFAGTEKSSRLSAQFPQIQTQAAAHAADVAGLHVAVDVIGEIRRAVLGRHFKQQPVVFRLRPVEILGNGIGGDGVLESSSVGVSLDHGLDKRLVDHVHLRLAISVGKVHLFSAYDGRHGRHIRRHRPVQGNVGKRCLGAPAAGGINAVDKRLDALFHLVIGQVIRLDKGRQVGVKRGKRLGPRPLVLHNAQEIDHLVAQHRQMLGRRRGDLAGNAAQPFQKQLL